MQMAPLIVVSSTATGYKEQAAAPLARVGGGSLSACLWFVRRGMDWFTPSAFFALMAVAGLASAIRHAPSRGIPSIALSTGFSPPPSLRAILMIIMGDARAGRPAMWHVAGAIVVTSTGYYAITTGCASRRFGGLAVPLRAPRVHHGPRHPRLRRRPDALTLTGAAIILVAGLYTFLRERQLSRRGG